MQPHVSLITLAVESVAEVRAFYVERLGWEPVVDTDDVVMIRAGASLILSLWARGSFAAEIGEVVGTGSTAPIALSHNVASDGDVDRVLAAGAAAGATVTSAAKRPWGGYSGYLVDPAGFRWEIAHNPDPRYSAVTAPSAG